EATILLSGENDTSAEPWPSRSGWRQRRVPSRAIARSGKGSPWRSRAAGLSSGAVGIAGPAAAPGAVRPRRTRHAVSEGSRPTSNRRWEGRETIGAASLANRHGEDGPGCPD